MISDEAVEAAAKCHYEAELGVNWDDVRPSVKRGYLDDARRMLEAAAPYIAAAAWEEGMEAMYESTSHEWPPIPEANPYRSQA